VPVHAIEISTRIRKPYFAAVSFSRATSGNTRFFSHVLVKRLYEKPACTRSAHRRGKSFQTSITPPADQASANWRISRPQALRSARESHELSGRHALGRPERNGLWVSQKSQLVLSASAQRHLQFVRLKHDARRPHHRPQPPLGRLWGDLVALNATFVASKVTSVLSVLNTAEGWSKDVSEDVAHELRRRCAEQARDLPFSLEQFVDRYQGQHRPL
jgi:hypothetical protein